MYLILINFINLLNMFRDFFHEVLFVLEFSNQFILEKLKYVTLYVKMKQNFDKYL